MKRRLLLSLALLVAAPAPGRALAAPEAPVASAPSPQASALGRCGTVSPSVADVQRLDAALGRWRRERGSAPAGGTIRVALHVIEDGLEGRVTDRQIDDQIRVLNQSFAGTGYRFELASVDRTDNPTWFRMAPGTGRERHAKLALAIDPSHRLNLYTCAPGHDLLGWASPPYSASESDPMNGVVVHYGSLPGGSIAHYDQGRSAVHEVGHYLGLFHTFQFGCEAPGDYVDDTPFEASPAIGCPVGRNSCPDPGEDPIHNYMDYSDDACMTEFTPGQEALMDQAVAVYRPSLLGAAAPEAAGREVVPEDAASPGDETRAIEFRGAFPNPFHAETAIRFSVPHSERVTLRVYTLTGQLARTLIDAQLPAGSHSALLASGDLPSGMYYLVLRVGRAQMTRSVILVR